LLGEFGDPQAVCVASRSALGRIVPNEVADAILRGPDTTRIDGALRWLEEPGNHIISLADAAYPRFLLEISDPPPLLYVKGDTGLLNRAALAVVGSRNATPQGCANSEAFARELSDGGFTIVSGLALGIDAAAHRGGLAGASSSLAVVGTGLDIVYPARNRDLAHQLAAQGALVSEFPLGTPALSGNFPRRNRLLSGLARGCLIVEAALKSGSLITARYALEQGREVFAIPGSIHSPLSKVVTCSSSKAPSWSKTATTSWRSSVQRCASRAQRPAKRLPHRSTSNCLPRSVSTSSISTRCASAAA